MPGFTHLQAAQLVTLGHRCWLCGDVRARPGAACRCPSAAEREPAWRRCVGRYVVRDRSRRYRKGARLRPPTANSLDSVSDRDFVLEYVGGGHLCRSLSWLGEEIVIWSSAQFRFAAVRHVLDRLVHDATETTPDAAEPIRGRLARPRCLHGDVDRDEGPPAGLFQDMQEDKQPVFDAAETLMACLTVAARMMANVARPAVLRTLRAVLTATDLADWLSARLRAVPGSITTGRVVSMAGDGCGLKTWSRETRRNHVRITEDVFNVLGVNNSVRSRKSLAVPHRKTCGPRSSLRGSVFCHDRALDNDLYYDPDPRAVGLSLWKETP